MACLAAGTFPQPARSYATVIAVDRELEKFVTAPVVEGRRRAQRIPPVRLVLTIALTLAVASVLAPTFDELLFSFRRAPAVDVGDAMSIRSGSLLPEGSRIAAHVVLGNRAAEIPLWRGGSLRFGPIVIRQVLGSPIWVEYQKSLHPTWGPFVEADVDGRVVPFTGELSEARKLVELQGADVPPDARVIIADEHPGDMGNYVVAWTLGLALVIWSILGLVRASKRRVVEDDGVA